MCFYFVTECTCLPRSCVMHVKQSHVYPLVCLSAGSACFRPPAWYSQSLPGFPNPLNAPKATELCQSFLLLQYKEAKGSHSGPSIGWGICWGQQLRVIWKAIQWLQDKNQLPTQEVVVAEPPDLFGALALMVSHSPAWRKSDANLEQLTHLLHLHA